MAWARVEGRKLCFIGEFQTYGQRWAYLRKRICVPGIRELYSSGAIFGFSRYFTILLSNNFLIVAKFLYLASVFNCIVLLYIVLYCFVFYYVLLYCMMPQFIKLS